MFKLFQRLTLIYIFIFLLLVVLTIHTFRPELVNVDRYTIILFVFLFIVSILPSLQSGKISYFFEFKRDLEKAKESVSQLKKAIKLGDEAAARVTGEARENIVGANACLACGWLRQKINTSLIKMNQVLEDKNRSKATDPDKLLDHLNRKKRLEPKMYQAAKDVLRLCDPDKPFEEMNADDAQQITNISLPLLQYLEDQTLTE
jgi:hypothetical protein